jgi:alkyl sulfatase BDS1-like metallo-beta-lactamase superfamily hydrolase
MSAVLLIRLPCRKTAKSTYARYLGWFNGNPATLHELPERDAAAKYVEFMGGADAVLEKAKKSSMPETIAGSHRS